MAKTPPTPPRRPTNAAEAAQRARAARGNTDAPGPPEAVLGPLLDRIAVAADAGHNVAPLDIPVIGGSSDESNRNAVAAIRELRRQGYVVTIALEGMVATWE